jgi:AcrR family transcriptional regulator
MSDSRHKNKGEFRREILDAARELFSSDGYGNFSMRKLAKRIGYSPTTIYLYFRDKDELLFHLCEELFSEMDGAVQRLSEGGAGPLQVLRNALLMYVEFCLANPEHYRVAFFTSPVVYGSPREYLERDTMSRRAYFRYRDLVAECCADGVLRPMDLDLLAQVLWAGMHGVVAATIYSQDFPLAKPDVLAETMVEGLLNGFRK